MEVPHDFILQVHNRLGSGAWRATSASGCQFQFKFATPTTVDVIPLVEPHLPTSMGQCGREPVQPASK
ncbi:hypothetical protein F1880_001401 [Penicillium rolfsii]|nr:hypothetical protein F1880_001401 [Penicillium rolfsii]